MKKNRLKAVSEGLTPSSPGHTATVKQEGVVFFGADCRRFSSRREYVNM